MTKKQIYNDIEKRIDKAKVEDKYSLFMFDCVKKVLKKDPELVYDTIVGWDDICSISYEDGQLINELMNDKDNIIAFHRTRFNYREDNGLLHSDNLDNIMCNGLINFGDKNAIGGSVFSSIPPSINKTMTPLIGIAGIIQLVGSYKSNNTVVFASFPRELVDDELKLKNDKDIDKIYYKDGIEYVIRPEYIQGAIIKNNNGFDKYYLKNEILESRYNMEHNIR